MANCCVWDFSISAKEEKEEDTFLGDKLEKLWKHHCKKWCFQKEKGEKTGYLHYQGRVSFKCKQRLTGCKRVHPTAKWSPTATINKDNNFYVIKEETRITGRDWKDQLTIDENYIPRQIRMISTLYPWQNKVLEISKTWNNRCIDVLIDTDGNSGKSTLMGWMECYENAKMIPPVNNAKDLIRMVYCIGISKVYMIDMPRAMNKENLGSFYSALEYVKGGRAYDDRYSFRSRFFDSPNIWIFSNKTPDIGLLTRDRWRLWKIENKELSCYKIENEFVVTDKPVT